MQGIFRGVGDYRFSLPESYGQKGSTNFVFIPCNVSYMPKGPEHLRSPQDFAVFPRLSTYSDILIMNLSIRSIRIIRKPT